MNSKLHTLEANGTWEVTDLPPGRKAIGCNGYSKLSTILMALSSNTRLG